MELWNNWASEKDLWLEDLDNHKRLIDDWTITSLWIMREDEISDAVAGIIELRRGDWDLKPLNFNDED